MTEKIEKSLSALIKAQPDSKFHVLIVHATGTNFSGFPLSQFQKLMDNISSAWIFGRDIVRLAEREDVVFIEADTEMDVMQ